MSNFMNVEKVEEGKMQIELFSKGEEVTAQCIFEVETDYEDTFLLALASTSFADLNNLARIRPVDVGIHSKRPYPGVRLMLDMDGVPVYCKHVDGECYYDGSILHAEEMLRLWKNSGRVDVIYDSLEELVSEYESRLA